MIPALVIGGGPAGAALATEIAHAGCEVTVVERAAAACDKVCGEFLSREACVYLERLGVDLASLGALPIHSVRVCTNDKTATVALPFPALSLSRSVVDEALLRCAAAAGAQVRRGVEVLRLQPTTYGFSAALGDGTTIAASTVFLATGKHDLRGHCRPAGRQNDLVAFKQHWHLAKAQSAALAGHVELVMFDGGYAGLQTVEDGRANLCFAVRQQTLRRHGGFPQLLAVMRTQSPHLDMRLAGGSASAERPLALSKIPYGHVRRHADGIWHLGDQAAVIPSFCGDGISIALHSAHIAAATYLAGGSAERYQRRLARDVAGQVLMASLISQAMVRPLGQRVLQSVAGVWPGLVAAVAMHTRIPQRARTFELTEAPST